jgi:hypothetical protein
LVGDENEATHHRFAAKIAAENMRRQSRTGKDLPDGAASAKLNGSAAAAQPDNRLREWTN